MWQGYKGNIFLPVNRIFDIENHNHCNFVSLLVSLCQREKKFRIVQKETHALVNISIRVFCVCVFVGLCVCM